MSKKYHLCPNEQLYEGEGDTLLEALEDARVFKVEADGEGGATITEKCDEWFAATLTPQQLRELAAELVALADTLHTGATS